MYQFTVEKLLLPSVNLLTEALKGTKIPANEKRYLIEQLDNKIIPEMMKKNAPKDKLITKSCGSTVSSS